MADDDEVLEIRPGVQLATELGQIPVPPEVMAAAEWYDQHHRHYLDSLRLLREWTLEHGQPILLANGRVVSQEFDGYDWDAAAVAQLAPQLVAEVRAEIVGTKAEVEQGLSVACEEVPDLGLGEIKYKLNRDALIAVMRTDGSPLREKLRVCRKSKTKLGIR
jgi:hypothetical protein